MATGAGSHLNTQIFVSRGHPGLRQDEPRPLATVAGTRGRSGGRAPQSKREAGPLNAGKTLTVVRRAAREELLAGSRLSAC